VFRLALLTTDFRAPFHKCFASGILVTFIALAALSCGGQPGDALLGTQPLTWDGDLSARMVEGIDRFLMREIELSVGQRQKFWHREFSSRDAYERSVQPNREHLQTAIGAVDARLASRFSQ